MKSHLPFALHLNDKMKNPKSKAFRRRKGLSLSTPVGIGALFLLIIAAALYTSSSVSASRGVSRVSLPTDAARSSTKDKTGPSTRGLKDNLLPGNTRDFLSVLRPPPQPAQSPSLDESVATYEVVTDLCTSTAKNTFVLGDKVCVRVENAPLRAEAPLRRVNFSDPRGFVRDTVDVMTDPQQSMFTLPTNNTSVVDGVTIDNRGTWSASSNSTSDGGTRAIAYFNVSDPDNVAADLVVYDFSTENDVILPGTNTGFLLWLSNYGPDAAANVHLTMAVPPNMSYLSATTSSAFTCVENLDNVVDCTLPAMTSWASGAIANITLNFSVSGGAPDGVISSTADIASDTNDPRPASNSSVAMVEVRSTGGPPATCSLGCPADIVVTATSPAGAVVNFAGSVEVSGDCGTITYFPASGSTIPIGVNSVDVMSGGGTGGSCSFTVTVIDPAVSPAPTIACPLPDLTAAAPSGTGEATVPVTQPAATGTGVSVSSTRSDNQDVSDPYPVGTTIITWTATDSDQRTASCTQRVIVTSVDFPTITCPTDKTFDAGGDCQKTLTAGEIGEPTMGGLSPTRTSRRSDDLALTDPFPAGQTTITWTATNAFGSASCTQVITITSSGDSTPPTLTIPADVSVTTATCSALVDDELGVATATDNCSTVSITRTGVPNVACPIPGNPTRTCETFVFPVGTTDVTYTATDAQGNTTNGVQHVTVHETSPPVFTFVPGSVGPINNDPGLCGAFIGDATLGTATVSDNCDTTVIRTGVPAGNIFPVGDTTITFTAKADLAVTATQHVIVTDNTPPVVTPPAAVTLYTGSGATSCGVTVADLNGTFGTGSAIDNCPGVGPVTRGGVPAGNFFPVGPTTLTYSATDAHGNTGSANQLVTVVDNTPPQISCQADIVADYNPAVNGAVVTFTPPVGTDNCASSTILLPGGIASGGTFPVGTTTNTYKVTDASLNTAQCSFKVTVALTSLIGLDSVTMTGAGYADSYSSVGGYPATKGSLANVLSNGTITMGNSSKVWGNVRSTRAGVNMTGASQVTGNATAGTTVTTSGSASVGGTRTNNALAPVMTLPSVAPCSPFSSNSGITGTYTYNASTGDLTLSGVNIATLANGNYCFHNITLGNSAQLKVNGPVVIKMTGTLNTSGASNLNNTTQIPSNLRILSSYSGSGNGVIIGNSVRVYALIYSPRTGLNMSGAAPLFGTAAAKTITIGNSGAIHYDTQLKATWPAIWTLIFGP